MRLRHVLLSVACVALAGCGTFSLASEIVPPKGKTADQQQLDVLACKDQATLAANAGDKQAAEFLLGFTIIGYPAGVQMDRDTQRETFKQCMEARGYTVLPPDGQQQSANAGVNSPPEPVTPQPSVTLGINAVSLNLTTANALGLSSPIGAQVLDITPGLVADRAGIKIGDVILKIGTSQVELSEGVRSALVFLTPGMKVPIIIWRNKKQVTLTAAF